MSWVYAPDGNFFKPFTSWQDASEYAKSLPVDLWDVRLKFDGKNTYYVKAVRK